MLVRIVCRRCRVGSLWTDEPQCFLEAVCPRRGECEAVLTEVDGNGHHRHSLETPPPHASAAEPHYEPLSALDSFFLFTESANTPMHIGLVTIFEAGSLRRADGRIDVARIRAHVASRLHWVSRYRQRLEFVPFEGQPVWVDDPSFNLEDHVRYLRLVSARSDRALKELAGRLLAKPLDRQKPLWETWVIDGLPGNRFAMVNKVHHCMMDGVAGAGLVAALLSADPNAPTEEPIPWAPRPHPGDLELLRREMTRRGSGPFDLARSLWNGFTGIASVGTGIRETLQSLWESLVAALPSAAPTALNGEVHPGRRFEWTSFDLKELRELKSRLGGTLNDIMLATVCGAVQRFLKEKRGGEAPEEFRVAVPVSVRKGAEEPAFGNRASIWLLNLPIAERDPLRRLDSINQATAGLKASGQAAGIDSMLRVADRLGPEVVRLGAGVLDRLHPFNLLVTNVHGPETPLYLLGARMLAAYPEVPLFHDQGLAIALFSCGGKVHWGFNADRELMPDLGSFVQAVHTSFRELATAAGLGNGRAHRGAELAG